MSDYPRHIRGHSPAETQLVCCKCGADIPPGAKQKVLALAPGKYLCAKCEEDRENMRMYGVKDRDLIERVKKYSMDWEGEAE